MQNKDKAWICAVCVSMIVGTMVGFLHEIPTSTDTIKETYGAPPYMHYLNPKITENQMMEEATFSILTINAPAKWHLLETRAIRIESELKGVLFYYDIDKNQEADSAALTVVQTSTLRTPEKEKAFIQRLKDMKFDVQIETMSGVEVVFESDGAYFLANSALYHAFGESQDVIRAVISDMARQVK